MASCLSKAPFQPHVQTLPGPLSMQAAHRALEKQQQPEQTKVPALTELTVSQGRQS